MQHDGLMVTCDSIPAERAPTVHTEFTCGNMTVGPRQSLYSPLCCMPHDVADWVKRWLGEDADGTAV